MALTNYGATGQERQAYLGPGAELNVRVAIGRVAECIGVRHVENCLVAEKLKLAPIHSVDAVKVVCAPPVIVNAVGDPVVDTG